MINSNPGQRVVEHQAEIAWQASPSKQVLRKRFHLVGPVESGQVTSLVRYQPGSEFPRHEHPDGEEILVLEGVFSDEAGDWPAGTWLLNPEGFSHAPYSVDGCLLFVKLRQYSGGAHKAICVENLAAVRGEGYHLMLLDQHGSESTAIIDVPAGSVEIPADGGAEGFVLSGQADIWGETIAVHDWFRVPPGESLQFNSAGCRLYLKQGAVQNLATGPLEAGSCNANANGSSEADEGKVRV